MTPPHPTPECRLEPAAWVSVPVEQWKARFQVNWVEHDHDDRGQASSLMLRLPSGAPCFLQTMDTSRPGAELHLPADDTAAHLDAFLEAYHLTSADLAWVRDDIRMMPHALYRTDTHGGCFLVATHPCRADAMAQVHKLTQAVHKQYYEVMPVAG